MVCFITGAIAGVLILAALVEWRTGILKDWFNNLK
jgi:hypothetical protein